MTQTPVLTFTASECSNITIFSHCYSFDSTETAAIRRVPSPLFCQIFGTLVTNRPGLFFIDRGIECLQYSLQSQGFHYIHNWNRNNLRNSHFLACAAQRHVLSSFSARCGVAQCGVGSLSNDSAAEWATWKNPSTLKRRCMVAPSGEKLALGEKYCLLPRAGTKELTKSLVMYCKLFAGSDKGGGGARPTCIVNSRKFLGKPENYKYSVCSSLLKT